MTAVRIASTAHAQDSCDIMLFDTIANADVLAERIERSGFFHRLYLSRTRKYMNLSTMKRRVMPLVFRHDEIPDVAYGTVYWANVFDWVGNSLIHALRKKNPNLCVVMYEDGFATYSEHYGDFMSEIKTCGLLKRLYYRKIFSEYYRLKDVAVYSSELMCWKPEGNVRPIPKITADDAAYHAAINTIFGYGAMQDQYDRPYIFFEESYYADHIEVGDVEVIRRLADIVGSEKLFVKIHPRNPVNRFQQMGIVTNVNTEIPWEVIAMNIDLEDKILLTIASGSALTSLINMRSEPKKIIMLMDSEDIDDSKLTPTLPLLRKIAYMNKNNVFLPKNTEELISYLSAMSREDTM